MDRIKHLASLMEKEQNPLTLQQAKALLEATIYFMEVKLFVVFNFCLIPLSQMSQNANLNDDPMNADANMVELEAGIRAANISEAALAARKASKNASYKRNRVGQNERKRNKRKEKEMQKQKVGLSLQSKGIGKAK